MKQVHGRVTNHQCRLLSVSAIERLNRRRFRMRCLRVMGFISISHLDVLFVARRDCAGCIRQLASFRSSTHLPTSNAGMTREHPASAVRDTFRTAWGLGLEARSQIPPHPDDDSDQPADYSNADEPANDAEFQTRDCVAFVVLFVFGVHKVFIPSPLR